MKIQSIVCISLLALMSTAYAQINWTEHVIEPNFSGAISIWPVDLDDDSDIDIVGAAYNQGKIAWFENDGSENFTQHTVVTGFSGVIFVTAGDIDGDTDVDILGTSNSLGCIVCWKNDGNENFTPDTIASAFAGMPTRSIGGKMMVMRISLSTQ